MPLTGKLTDAERRVAEKRNKHQMLCSYPGCRRPAADVTGFVREISAISAVCTEHLATPATPKVKE